MDELALEEVLGRTVAPDGPRPSIDRLRGRIARRRRRRRAAAGGVLAMVVLVGVAAAAASSDVGRARVVTTAPTVPPTPTTTVPARPAGPATLTVGAVPEGMEATGCSVLSRAQDLRVCSFSVPGGTVPVAVSLSWVPGSATEELRRAWADGDATGAAALLGGEPGPAASFDDSSGTRVLVRGEVDRVDGSSLGLPDRVARGYAVLVDDTVVQANSEAALPETMALLASISVEPRWPALDGVLDALPEGTQVIAQGVRSRWAGVRGLPRGEPTPPPADAYGADLLLPDSGRTGIVVEVTDGIDTAAFFEQLTTGGRTAIFEQLGPRSVALIEGSTSADTVLVPSATQLVVAVDEDTLLVVAATSAREADDLGAVAERVLPNLG